MKRLIVTLPNSGSHMLLEDLGIRKNNEAIPIWMATVEQEALRCLKFHEDLDDIWAHIVYSDAVYAEAKRQGRYIIFNYRDPRDMIVSYCESRDNRKGTFDEAVEYLVGMKPWENKCDEIYRFEELIQGRETPSVSFRLGIVGNWRNKLDMGKYAAKCGAVKSWEYTE